MFEQLYNSAKKGELILRDGGMVRYHLTKAKQLTIYEIVVLPEMQGLGIGKKMLQQLKSTKDATSIFAKCPVDLAANDWYKKQGFILEEVGETRTGRKINHWRLVL